MITKVPKRACTDQALAPASQKALSYELRNSSMLSNELQSVQNLFSLKLSRNLLVFRGGFHPNWTSEEHKERLQMKGSNTKGTRTPKDSHHNAIYFA